MTSSHVANACPLWPGQAYLAELKRPWKVATFAAGMAWLLYGALNYGIADWDVGVSILMGGLTYVCSPWSVRVILNALRYRPPGFLLHILSALGVALLVVHGAYWAYHTAMGNEMYRAANLAASSALYFLAGTLWLYRGSLRDLLANLQAL
jgi:hypothetical protein